MPYFFHVDKKEDLWYVFGYGLATGEEYIQVYLQSSQLDGFHGDIDLLLDFTYIEQLDFSYESLKKIMAIDLQAQQIEGYDNYRISAITRNIVDEGVLTLYTAMMNNPAINFNSFKSLNKALAWLGKEKAVDRIKNIRQKFLQKITSSE